MPPTKYFGTGILLFLAILSFSAASHASGARWYTGAPFYTVRDGQPVIFFTTSPLYYTDSGSLNANVTHAQADAMVAAAAAVWNVPTSNLTLAQGGTLAQHVSSDNTYFDGTSVIFPDDVKLANYHAKPIAIIYDTDGSVIDTLLGSGASSPSGCRQNGVVEDVDGLDPLGTIDHAILILNGRCVGANPDQLMQMQYQLMREFGRIIGLAWSQLNDNVFTGIPTPTAIEVANWPVMHPIDIICGPYTYKCMAQPFRLRADDLSSLAQLYPVTSANMTSGKTVSSDGALSLVGLINFSTGQGMDAVNVVMRRHPAYQNTDAYEIISAVTGATYRQFDGNPITGPAIGPAQSSGSPNEYNNEGLYVMQRVPIVGDWESLYVTTEPINPLYSGDYAIAPYIGTPTIMSGAPVILVDDLEHAGASPQMSYVVQDAPGSCNTGSDGQESAPAASDPTGWWTGLLCDDRHTAWSSQSVKAARSWTLEMTAVDEKGIGSDAKTRIQMGLWNSADATGTPPTVATAGALNARVVGMTQLHMDASSTPQSYRFAIADERGRGRPDFAYKARLLYADTLSPVQLGPSGGRITIAGSGFRSGNVVTVNGAAATVISWTATQIVATAPTMRAANMTAAGSADVAVVDATTGGTTVMQAALSYGGTAINSIVLVSAPAQVETGVASTLSVRVFSTDGITPAPGATVQFAATGAASTFAACGSPTCTLTTDANGLAQSSFAATAAGPITLTATEQSGGAFVQATVNAVTPVRTVTTLTNSRYLAAGFAANWSVAIAIKQDGSPVAGQAVTWTTGAGVTLGSASSTTDASGIATVAVSTTGLGAGTQVTTQGCAWTTVCASSIVFGVDSAQWIITATGGTGQSITASATLAPVTFLVTDQAGHPLQGATVNVYQTVDGWQGVCPPKGRCAAAPVLASSQKAFTSDASGLVTLTPLEVTGIASVVNIAAVTGKRGFISLSLTKTP